MSITAKSGLNTMGATRLSLAFGFIQTEVGTLCTDSASDAGSQVVIAIRPEDIELRTIPSGDANEFEGEVVSAAFCGDYTLYQIQTHSKMISKKAMGILIPPGKVYFHIPKDRIRVFRNRELSSTSRKT